MVMGMWEGVIGQYFKIRSAGIRNGDFGRYNGDVGKIIALVGVLA